MTRVIRFYRVGDEHGSFSNFAPYPIEVDGKTRPTSEHYFQTQEFAGTEHEEAVRPAGSPLEAARMGRDRGQPLRPDGGYYRESRRRRLGSGSR